MIIRVWNRTSGESPKRVHDFVLIVFSSDVAVHTNTHPGNVAETPGSYTETGLNPGAIGDKMKIELFGN